MPYRQVHVKNLKTGLSFDDHFDNLIIAAGSVPVILKFSGGFAKNIFTLKTIDDAINLKRHIEGSLLIHIDELRDNLGKLNKDDLIILYCKTGYRSYLGLRILRNNGSKNVKLLNGSYLSWEKKI